MARQNSLDDESLFSLELVVDKFKLQQIACRFPAIAFRLLDFPTLMIYHVEPDLAVTIKEKLAIDPHYKVPSQLTELQDREGYFPVKKGKSCLFRVPGNVLMTHLQNVPLYVMIVDTYPDTPKLLASCTVPLDTAMENVYDEITSRGLSVPAVCGEKGKYSVHNLMGIELGHIFLGYRILSLGIGLMAHIPSNQVMRMGRGQMQYQAKTSQSAQQRKQPQEDEVMITDIKTTDRLLQVGIGKPELMEQSSTQTAWAEDVKQMKNTTVQTEKCNVRRKTPKTNLDIESQLTDHLDDLVISNSICPPPLYYNSRDEMCLPVSGGSGIDDLSDSSESQFGTDDTIREEDKFSDTELNISHCEPTGDYFAKSDLKAKKDKVTLWLDEPKNKIKGPLPTSGTLGDFPLLNMLISEVVAMQSNKNGYTHTVKSADLKSKKIREANIQPHKKESRDQWLSRISSPRRNTQEELDRQNSEPRKIPHHSCLESEQEPPAPSTKNKGWLRPHQPAGYGVKKTKLAYGMTNTQRLRLAKGNPSLLKTLEKEEEDRVQKRREKNISKYPWLRQQGSISKLNTQDISTEISRHKDDRAEPIKSDTKKARDVVTDGMLSPRRKPVPTPRMSLTDTREKYLLTQQGPPNRVRETDEMGLSSDKGGYRINKQQDADSFSDNSQKQRSVVEIHVPSGSLHDDSFYTESEATAGDVGEDWKDDQFGQTRVINTTDIHEDTKIKDDMGADSEWHGDVPGLRRMVDVYSDDDSSAKSAKLGNEPELRRIVDVYSEGSDNHSSKSNSRSFHSALSETLEKPGKVTKSVSEKPMKMNLPELPNPSSSKQSPKTAMKLPTIAIREPMAGSSPSQETATPFPEATPRSARSVESISGSGHFRPTSPRRPMPSPRRSVVEPRLDSLMSQKTESISSYAPSEGENMSPVSPGPYYSDDFDDDQNDSNHSDVVALRGTAIGDIRADPEARFGYTWN